MKKIIFMAALLLLVLSACNEESAKKEDTKPAETQKENTSKQSGQVEDSEPKEEKEAKKREGKLTEVGQIIKESRYSAELMKIKDLDKTLEKGPLSLHLIDAKLIKMFDLSSKTKEMIQQYTSDAIADEITYIQLQYKAKNNSDKDVSWSRIENVVTDTNKQVSANNEFLSRELIYNIFSGAEVDYLNGYIVDSNTNHLRLIFSPVYKYDSFDELSPQFEYEFSFNQGA